jgi:hypothetical protein
MKSNRTLSKSEVCKQSAQSAPGSEATMTDHDQHMKQYKNPRTGKMEWRYGPFPTSEEALHQEYGKIPEAKRAHFRKQAETWLEEGAPKPQPGEGKSTFILRCQEEDRNRETVVRQRTIKAYQESLKPTREQRFMAVAEKTAKVENEKRAAKEKVKAAAEKAKAEAQAKGRRMDKFRERGF